MPNWCSTRYRLTGEGAVKLKKLIEVDYEIGKTNKGWLGNIVRLLGGDEAEICSRGWINNYKLEDGVLTIDCETAWGELNEWRKFVGKELDTKIYYVAEEPGNDIYITNDLEFDDIYLLDTNDGREEFGKDQLDLCIAAICERIGKPIVGFKQVLKWAEEYNDANVDNDKYVYFHEYTYEDD